jgi:hypothetical protein
MGTGVLSKVKVARDESDHLPPSSASVKNKWNYASVLAYLHGVDGDKSTFIFYYNYGSCCSMWSRSVKSS